MNVPSDMRMTNQRRVYPNRIVNGMPINIEESPYQVVLLWKRQPFCGGVIISRRWVLTAAHCVKVDVSEVQIRAGSRISTYGGFVHTISWARVHEKYYITSENVPINDIGLLYVHKPFEVNRKIRPIKLFDKKQTLPVGALGKVSGWGFIKEDGSSSPYLLMTVLPIMTMQSCNKSYSAFGGLSKGQFCAGYEAGGTNACYGDSGGPFTIDGKLVGLVSGGYGCARPRFPAIFTEIAVYRDWIKKYTGL